MKKNDQTTNQKKWEKKQTTKNKLLIQNKTMRGQTKQKQNCNKKNK